VVVGDIHTKEAGKVRSCSCCCFLPTFYANNNSQPPQSHALEDHVQNVQTLESHHGKPQTKDILHVMRLLGHGSINNTLKYTQLVNFQNDDYVSKVANRIEEDCKLVEAGFEYVCDIEETKIFRKRK